MKKILTISLLTASLLFTGCAEKEIFSDIQTYGTKELSRTNSFVVNIKEIPMCPEQKTIVSSSLMDKVGYISAIMTEENGSVTQKTEFVDVGDSLEIKACLSDEKGVKKIQVYESMTHRELIPNK